MIQTPADKKKALRKRLEKAIKALPSNWISTFVHKYPQYAEMKTHVSNVSRGLSLDEAVIDCLEKFAETLKPIKK